MATSNPLAQLNRKIHAGVILVNDTNELLDVGVIDLLSGLSKEFVAALPEEGFPPDVKSEALDIEFHWVSEKGSKEPARLTSGLSIIPTDSFETCPTLDIVVTGAYGIGYQPAETELAFARKAYKECHAFISICGGVNLVLSSGIINGKTATAPRFLLPMFKQMAPHVNWVEKRWVRDDKLWTSGTLLNGMDLMGNFIKQTWATKEGNLASTSLKICGVPDRDVDYKDVPWPV